jgi:hypothetical protein
MIVIREAPRSATVGYRPRKVIVNNIAIIRRPSERGPQPMENIGRLVDRQDKSGHWFISAPIAIVSLKSVSLKR